ncbi:MAG: phosphoribosylanthranilate isomerase [Armatimonadetes bacterium]|nr:phosphoribosylanthranilate isomerase [Armatimonadota bacterium]
MNASDALYAEECGADALGFVMQSQSKRYVKDFDSIVAELSNVEARKVAVMGSYSEDKVARMPAGFFTDVQAILPLQPIVTIPVFRPRPGSDIQLAVEETKGLETVLLDPFSEGAEGGTGHTLDWGWAKEFVEAFAGKVILAGGLNQGNVAEAIKQVQPWGVDACSGTESAPGIKDRAKIKGFIDTAKGW